MLDPIIASPDSQVRLPLTLDLAMAEGENAQLCQQTQERSHLEEAIRFQAHLLNSVGEAIMATDLVGTIIYWNRAATKIYGWQPAEALGRNILTVTPVQLSQEQMAEIKSQLLQGESWSGECLMQRKDGSEFLAQITDSPVFDVTGNIIGIVGISADISERKELQEQLLQAQKIECIGRLAGGVAHDFNNLLTAILGYVQMASLSLTPKHPVMQDLEEIQKAAERAVGLTRQLLAFARRQHTQPQLVELNKIVQGTIQMLRCLIGEDIALTTQMAEQPLQTLIDPSQLEQVIVNLAVNARDAMPNGGQLALETQEVTLDENYAANHADVEPGNYVMLAVSDTGAGMSDKVKSHIFEPFFTTKEEGKGTGLGLATCYGIVKQAGGSIQVDSEVGHGATFRIYLPVAAPSRAKAAAEPNYTEELERIGSETILLAEDEPQLLEMEFKTLKRQGYSVLKAGDGQEALDIVRQDHNQSIHLILTDLIMPGMSGLELIERARQLHPESKALLTSGYTKDRISDTQLSEMSIERLQKPFNRSELLQKVRQALDSRSEQ